MYRPNCKNFLQNVHETTYLRKLNVIKINKNLGDVFGVRDTLFHVRFV